MSFRFRLGPFTFGRTGVRLSMWGGGSGFSVPLSGKGRSFGKVGVGPMSWYFTGSPSASLEQSGGDAEASEPRELDSHEQAAIDAFRSDQKFLERLLRYGVPWRGVQERLKEELPDHVSDQDKIAYGLVSRAMDAAFGQQDKGWKTEKRPSKSGQGNTTWVVAIRSRI